MTVIHKPVIIERTDGGVSLMHLTRQFYIEVAYNVMVTMLAPPAPKVSDAVQRLWYDSAAPVLITMAADWADKHDFDLGVWKVFRLQALNALPEYAQELSRVAPEVRPKELIVEGIDKATKAAIELTVDKWQADGIDHKGQPVKAKYKAKRHELLSGEHPPLEHFESWQHLGDGKVGVNLTKLRQRLADRIREERAPKLAELDVLYMRADEAGDKEEKRRIAKQKQRLRELPATFMTATSQSKSHTEIAGLFPTWLSEPSS